jgi:translation elongation factor EF-1alpha
MSLTGMVDKRTLEKYEREAREKSRESWYLSWALDTNQEGLLTLIQAIKSSFKTNNIILLYRTGQRKDS